MFIINAEEIFVINFEWAPALFSFGKYLFQNLQLGIQFFSKCLNKYLNTYHFSPFPGGIDSTMVETEAGNTEILSSNKFGKSYLGLKVRFMLL